MSRRLGILLLAVVAATGLLATPAGTSEVRAATPDLTIVGNARYVVQPDAQRVRVTVDLVLTNHLRDTATKRYYFDRAFLAVMPGASGFKLTSKGAGSARAVVSKKTSTYTLLQLNLGRRIYSGKTNNYKLVFDLVDKGGAASREVRVGGSLVAFPVWAFATDSTPGSTVKVTFPAGYQVEVQSGEIPAPVTAADGTITLQTAKLDKPLTFFAYLVADRPASYAEQTETATIGGKPIDLDDPGVDRRHGVGRAGRRPGLARPAGPVRADRPALAARRRPRLPRDDQPNDRRLCRAVRSVHRARSRSPTTPATSWSSMSRRMPGSTAAS